MSFGLLATLKRSRTDGDVMYKLLTGLHSRNLRKFVAHSLERSRKIWNRSSTSRL
jgi:hypothetical protein